MSGLGMTSYAVAALAFLLLTVLLITSRQSRWQGAWLIAASAVTALWALLMALESRGNSLPFLVVYVAEVLRDGIWIWALTAIAGAAAPRMLAIGARSLSAALLVAPLAVPLLNRFGFTILDPTLMLSRAGLILALMALVLLEQIYRNSPQAARSALKFFTIGLGVVFTYDLFLYSQTELLRGVSADAWNARGILTAFAVPLVIVAVRRNPAWSLDIFVSRQMVFYTTTFMAVGIYLVVMAIGGYYVREVGGTWGSVGQIVFLAGAVVVLVSLVASTTLRRHARVFISKHFYRNKYDYRVEWLRFIATLSSTEEEDVRRTALRAMAQIFSSPGGILVLREDSGRRFVPFAAWPMRIDTIPEIRDIGADEDLPAFLQRTRWIIDMQELQRSPDVYGNLLLPPWVRTNPNLRIISPLLQRDQLVGFVALYAPPPPFELTYEDRDLLKTVGRHVATHIAQHEANRKLAESRQFEAYNRLTAFMMHDLKNSVAQLKLIVANSERHKRNPEFIDDAIGTIANTVERMTRLIEQLRGSTAVERLVTVDLAEIAREAVRRCSARLPRPVLQVEVGPTVDADPERLTAILEHIIRNAQDATDEEGSIEVSVAQGAAGAVVTVTDSGAGMDPEFVRERLFRPFDSTKGAKGMGIGAYQVREYVQALGGSVEVQSSPAQGTRFTVSLPLSGQASASRPTMAQVS